MPCRHLEMLAFMIDFGDSRRLVGDPTVCIPLYSIICPGSIPQTVNDVHVLFCDLIALIVRHKVFAKCIRRSLRPTCDDVPGDSAFGEMIKSAECSSEREGRNVACASCHSERY